MSAGVPLRAILHFYLSFFIVKAVGAGLCLHFKQEINSSDLVGELVGVTLS